MFVSFEIETITKCTLTNKSKGFQGENTNLESYLSTIDSEKDINLFWQNNYRGTPIKLNGTPFVLLNTRRYVCSQGKGKNAKTKKQRKEEGDRLMRVY